MKVVIVCEFTPHELDLIEYSLGAVVTQFGGEAGVWPQRCDALQDACEIINGLRNAIWQAPCSGLKG
jgi:hypothetical protein